MTHVEEITVEVPSSGLYEFTMQVRPVVERSGVGQGICTLFVRHTSASLVIQENADPSARRDMEAWMNRFVPEGDPLYTHLAEGADDMPAHIKSLLTDVSISIPVLDGELVLGTWQGIYLWEHRRARGRRTVVIAVSE